MGQPRLFTAQDVLDAVDRAVKGCKEEQKIYAVTLQGNTDVDFNLEILATHYTPKGLHVVVRHLRGLT